MHEVSQQAVDDQPARLYRRTMGATTVLRRRQDHEEPSLETSRSVSIGKVSLVLLVALILVAYAYPALRTSAATGSRQLPPLHAPDLSLYLNISRLTSPSPGLIVNPYYGIDVPSGASGHL